MKLPTPPATSPSTPTAPTRRRRPPGPIRRARRQAQAQVEQLTDHILEKAATLNAEAQAAATLTPAGLTTEELQAWQADFTARLRLIAQHPEQNLGHIEEQLAQSAQEPLRLLAQRAAQLKANTTPCQCPDCQRSLDHRKFLVRTIHSRFGALRLYRAYGWCDHCAAWHFPADYALGLDRNSPASPYVQELSALLVSKMPAEQAGAVAARLGLRLSARTLHREACRQGDKAQQRRAEFTAELDSWEGLTRLAAASEGSPATAPFTLVIEIDAWNIRERDYWGQTKERREKGEELSRWHWVYMGTVFRLDHRGQTAGGRAQISQRGYVATRHGLEALMPQLYREAIARGLGQAQRVLVIADGALWIWNLAQDRFKDADQRLDLFHGDEHLWAVAHDLYGRSTPEARRWVAPLLAQVRQDQTPQVISTLTELLPRLTPALQEKVQKQIDYFKNNQNRMTYKAILDARQAVEDGIATPEQKLKAQEPLGSGAIESTCRQYQCRFKRTGQFWTLAGDESLMCLETFWRNDRWSLLFPHAQATSPALN